MARSKTKLRHVSKSGNVVRVTKEKDAFFIGNTNERAEGKMTHYNDIDYNGSQRRVPDYFDLDDDCC